MTTLTQLTGLETGGQRYRLREADWSLVADADGFVHVGRLNGGGRPAASLCGHLGDARPYVLPCNSEGWPPGMCPSCREAATERELEIVVAPPSAEFATVERILRGQDRAEVAADGGERDV